MNITKLSSKCQITIPKHVRDKLNLKSGNKIIMEIVEDAVLIRPLEKPSESVRGIGWMAKGRLENINVAEPLKKMRAGDKEEL